VLGIAALVLAAALAVIAVLLSQDGDSTRVKPLREETTKVREQGSKYREGPVPGIAWAAKPRQGPPPSSSQGKRPHGGNAAGTGGHPASREGRPAARRHDDERDRRRRGPSKAGKPALPPAVPPAQPTPAPVPVSIPAGDSAPAAPDPAPAPPAVTQLSSPPAADPKPEAAPKVQAFEIEIVGGKLADKLHDVHPKAGHIRLRVRSNELVIVEVEGIPQSQPVTAGKDTLIELDSLSSKKYEVEIRRRKGVLTLLLERD
jgi:hypothetical protein